MPTHVLLDNEFFARDDRILLGEGLFETLKVVNSKPCDALLHWQRLKQSAAQLGICFDLSAEDWQHHLIAQIKCDGITDGGIKAILSGGSAPRGLTERGVVSQLFFQGFSYQLVQNPIRLMRSSWLRDEANPIYQMKSINYLESILARRVASKQGVDDVLFFNLNQHATETTCANLFIIQKDKLFTPRLADGVLPGITRSRILSCCAQNQIDCNEASLTQMMIEEADAMFITNSLQGIRPVASLDKMQFKTQHPLMDSLRNQMM